MMLTRICAVGASGCGDRRFLCDLHMGSCRYHHETGAIEGIF